MASRPIPGTPRQGRRGTAAVLTATNSGAPASPDRALCALPACTSARGRVLQSAGWPVLRAFAVQAGRRRLASVGGRALPSVGSSDLENVQRAAALGHVAAPLAGHPHRQLAGLVAVLRGPAEASAGQWGRIGSPIWLRSENPSSRRPPAVGAGAALSHPPAQRKPGYKAQAGPPRASQGGYSNGHSEWRCRLSRSTGGSTGRAAQQGCGGSATGSVKWYR